MPTTLYESLRLTHQISYQRWLSQELFSYQWFFLVISLIVIYAVWLKMLDISRLRELLLFGSLTAVSTTFIDLIGSSIGFWEYTIRIFPIYPATFPFDFTVVPILYMITLQYTSTWKDYVLGAAINSVVFGFIISPIFILLKIKAYHGFNYLYMFLLCFGLALFLKAVYNGIVSIETGQSKQRISSGVGLQPAVTKPLPQLRDQEEKDKK